MSASEVLTGGAVEAAADPDGPKARRTPPARLAGAAHDLKNALSVVLTQVVLLRDTSTDHRTVARAGKIGAAAERCVGIAETIAAIEARPSANDPTAPERESDAVDDARRATIAGSILIVDDEPEIVDVLREIVSPLAGRVDVASTGLEAVGLTASFDYDLMLSDVHMPELDGPGLYAALLGRGSGIPSRTVFITGNARDAALRDLLARTRLPVLEKPFMPADVRSVVTQAFSELRAA